MSDPRGTPRLIVVSNRVAPITEGEPAAGGLAVGVLDALKTRGGIWFGWSGEVSTDAEPAVHTGKTIGAITVITMDLSRHDYDEFYRGFANGALWPVLHYQIGLAKFNWADFAGYRRVNQSFARALVPLLESSDVIWAHDYHMLCLAEAMRQAGVVNRIGLFLHTPFPEPGVLMTLPAHAELVRAMTEFDLLGFQTEGDRTAFANYARRHAGGRSSTNGELLISGRRLRTGVYPIGVHIDVTRAEAVQSAHRGAAIRLREELGGQPLIISVDRLDYSKGLRQRFLAFEHFLNNYSGKRVVFLQIAPPSRSDVETYREIRHDLEAEAGRINGRFADLDWVPLRYLNRSFLRSALMPLFAQARIGLVTPLRDGMNLVAKEFVAAQDPNDPGILVLSQFAGAAAELTAALIVNPYDEAAVAAALEQGLVMGLEERRARHAAMLDVMRRNSLEAWRDRFLSDLMMV
jgi:trehalose 6-phosphate synthase